MPNQIIVDTLWQAWERLEEGRNEVVQGKVTELDIPFAHSNFVELLGHVKSLRKVGEDELYELILSHNHIFVNL